MNSVNRTLYIPLYGKALVNRMGIILRDPKADEIWETVRFPLKGKSASKWLAYYMGMRSAVIDRWTAEKMEANPDAVVLHLGCGLDSRCLRVGNESNLWFDVDFPEVIHERKKHFPETPHYKMISADLRANNWLSQLPGLPAIVVMEGVSMYLRREELRDLLNRLSAYFPKVMLMMDCYSEFAARASKFKNPINDVGVTEVYGLDHPDELASAGGFAYTGERTMTPDDLIGELSKGEQMIFRRLYAGSMARKLYRLYEFHTGSLRKKIDSE